MFIYQSFFFNGKILSLYCFVKSIKYNFYDSNSNYAPNSNTVYQPMICHCWEHLHAAHAAQENNTLFFTFF